MTLDKLQGYADDTKDMTATKGRAAYFKEDSKGYIDPCTKYGLYT